MLTYNFNHLQKIQQGYYEHFCDAIFYSWTSFKASFCFFVHSFYPDLFESDGSNYIKCLKEIIDEKYRLINNKNNKID